jgi:hypothetical protein
MSDLVKLLLACVAILAILIFTGIIRWSSIVTIFNSSVKDIGNVVKKGYNEDHSGKNEGFAGAQAGPQIDDSAQRKVRFTEPKPYSGDSSLAVSDSMAPIKHNTNVLAYPQISNTYSPQPNTADIYSQCAQKTPMTSAQLLPNNDPTNNWGLSNPQINTNLENRNFLETGHHFGIDTQGNSLRNANLQLRSDPIVQQIPNITPWGNTTIGPDTNRKQFEIGC